MNSFRASIRVTCLAGLLLLSSPASRGAISIDPLSWGLSPGDTFRLVLVTNGTTTATSTNIATYDAFVNSQGLSGILYQGSSLSWQALGLTPTSNPVTDLSRYSASANSVATYNLAGLQVSSPTNGTAFWRTTGFNTHLAAIDRTIDGSGNLAQVGGSELAWTGFDYDGTPATARNYNNSGFQISTVSSALGSTASYQGWNFGTNTAIPGQTLSPAAGRIGASANGWASLNTDSPLSTSYRMYAISEVITVMPAPAPVPESAAFGILLPVAVGALAFGRVRRRQTA